MSFSRTSRGKSRSMSGTARQLLVEEPAEEEPGLDWVDVREPRQITDDRAHARPAPAPRRQHAPRRVGSAHLASHLPRQLQEVGVEAEEAREAELADHAQLLFEAPACLAALGRAGVASLEARLAELRQLAVGIGILRAGVAVAVIGGEVEAEALGQAPGLRHRLRDTRRSAAPSRPAAPAPSASCRAGAHPSRRATRPAGSPPARPGAPPARGRARARCPWRRTARQGARRDRRASGCAPCRGARAGAGARRGSRRGRRRAPGARRAPPPRRSGRRWGCRRLARRSRRARRRERSPRGRRALRCVASRDESGNEGGRASRFAAGRVWACASVRSRQRFRHPSADSTRSVT